MSWDVLFYAAMILIAVPSMPFNRVAVVVVVVWALESYSANILGVPKANGDLALDAFGFVFAFTFALAHFRPANTLAAMMFIPMLTIDLLCMKHELHPYYCWWGSFGCGMVQILALPGGNDWHRFRKTWECYKRSSSVEWFFRVLARRHAL